MRTIVRRGTAMVAAVLTLLLMPGVAAAASPRAPVVADANAELPSYDTWIGDVAAVTDAAERYLEARLPDASGSAAIVLDIDNTALESAYSEGLWPPATAGVLAVAELAEASGAAVFFVTHRPDIIQLWTILNLRDAGYQVDGLYMRPTLSLDSAERLKTEARIAIEARGYTIVANIGNNDSDLNGGHAERTFKLPDYDGLLD